MFEPTVHEFCPTAEVLELSIPNSDEATGGNMNNETEIERKNEIESNSREKNKEMAGVESEEKSIEGGIKPKEDKKKLPGKKHCKIYPSKGWADILGNGELRMKIIQSGKRYTRPQPTDVCDIKLRGRLQSGQVVEDYDFLRIQIGDHEVVQGLELALPLMNVGDKALVIVGPRFAYGTIGNPPNIPPDATIKYVLELLRAEMLTPLENIPHEERMIMATAKRQRGNWWYARQDATKAIQCYRKAVDLLDETIPYVTPIGDTIYNSDDNIKIVVREKIKAFNNLAAAQLVVEAYDSAMASIVEVLKQEPNNVKALYRKSKILSAKGYIKEAVIPLRQACTFEPTNTVVLLELKRCLKMAEIEKRDEKNLYRKMLGQKPIDENNPEENSNVNKYNSHKFWKTAATATFMAAVAFAISYKFRNYPFI